MISPINMPREKDRIYEGKGALYVLWGRWLFGCDSYYL